MLHAVQLHEPKQTNATKTRYILRVSNEWHLFT